MDKRAQLGNVGVIIALFVGIVFVTSLLTGGIFENIGTVTQTRNVVNQTVVWTDVSVLSGQAVSNLVVTNYTVGTLIGAGNYSTVNYDVSTGVLRAYMTNTTRTFGTNRVNVSYTYEPLGYDTNAGGRAMTLLIAIFAAIAVISVIVWKIYDDGLFDMF